MSHHPKNNQFDLSIIIPVKDEVENIGPLTADIIRQVDLLGLDYEIIYVNDGSIDGTAGGLDQLAKRHAQVKIVHFAASFGQTAALTSGIEMATGKKLITMDGDRQNDPADIGMLLAKLDEGYGCVSGWRRDRQDTAIRRWSSILANRLISKATSLHLHDYGCTLKAYHADALDPSVLYGEMHRFFPVYVRARGGRICEMVVKHHPRVTGLSKYGLSRTARVLADLALVRLLFKYRSRPVHMFAKVAQYMVLTALAFGILGLGSWITNRGPLLGVPFLTAAILSVGAVSCVGIGLCCELVMRNHFYVLGRRPWRTERMVNFAQQAPVPDLTGSVADLANAR